MHLPNRKGWFAIFFLVFILAIPFAISFYVSTPSFKNRYQAWRKSSIAASLPSRSKITADQVLLLKNEKVFIDRTCIVFKGLTDKKVKIDLYLLDLDPKIPYPLSFSKKAVHEGVWLGNTMYSLLSVKQTVLRLKIQSSYRTL